MCGYNDLPFLSKLFLYMCSIYSVQVLLPPTLALLHFEGVAAICGGETCQLWVEQWAGFIKTQDA